MALVKTNLFAIMGWRVQGDIGPFTCYTSKRRDFVFFMKAPPDKPPSELQKKARQLFRMAALAWRGSTGIQKAKWELATKRLSLRLTGYNLFVWYYMKRDRAIIATIEQQSGVTLIED